MTTRFFHISDVHFGVEDRDALDRFAAAVADEQPDAVICTGDLTQRAKHKEFAEALRWFQGLDAPVMVQAGNHDMPYYNLWERFTDPYRRFYRLAADLDTGFQSDDLVIVPLVSTVRIQPRFPWSDGFVRRQALEATLAQLRGLEGDPRTIIVACHHPLLGAQDKSDNPTIGGEDAFRAIAALGADAVISGHIHTPFDEMRSVEGGNMRMIGTGTLSTRLRRGAPPSYSVISCAKGGKISCECRALIK